MEECYGLDSSGSGNDLVGGSFEQGNETSDSTKYSEFLRSWETGGFSRMTQIWQFDNNKLNKANHTLCDEQYSTDLREHLQLSVCFKSSHAHLEPCVIVS